MTLAQYNSIMSNVTDINKDILFFFTAENTKIMTSRYPKIEVDTANELLKAYIIHPNSTNKENPVYALSFVCTLDSIFGIQFTIKDGIENVTKDENGDLVTTFTPTLQSELEDAYLIGNYN